MSQNIRVSRGIGKYGSHKGKWSPEGMRDHFTAAKVHNVEAQVVVSLVCLKQRAICVWAKELET